MQRTVAEAKSWQKDAPNSHSVFFTTAIAGLMRARGLGAFRTDRSTPYAAGEYRISLTTPPMR
jgi:hypothetical protein